MQQSTTRRQFVRQSLACAGYGSIAASLSCRLLPRATIPAESYPLSCQTLPYRAYPLLRALEGIRAAGYRFVMPYHTHAGKAVFTPALSSSERSDLKKRLEDHNLTAHMSFIGLGTDLKTSKGEDEWKRELNLFREFTIRTVVGVGPWYYVKFPDQPRPRDQWERECALFYRGLERVLPHAENLGITITLKPHTGITATAKECLKVVRRVVSDHLKICWDAGNVSYYEGIHPDPDFPLLAPHVRAVCIKDHRGGRANHDFPVPGQGVVDHDLMFRTLFAAGFCGPISVERIDGSMDALKMPAELIDECILTARRFLLPLLRKYAH